MSSQTKRYLVPAQGPQIEPIKAALALLQKLCKHFQTDAILLVPTKRNVEGKTLGRALGPHISKALLKGKSIALPGGWNVSLETQRTFRDPWTSKVIIAVYATKKMLDQIDSATNAPAAIVVPWIMDDVRQWTRTWNPHVVGQVPTAPEVLIENPVVEEALKMLTHTVNLSTGLLHSSDRDAAVQLFRKLYENREPYDPDSIRAWAVRNRWAPEGADQLREVGQAILDGKRIRQGHPLWKANIIELLRERAKGG